MGSIEITNAEVDCPVQGFQRLVLLGIHQETAAATEPENGNTNAGPTQNARGQFGGLSCGEGRSSNQTGREEFEELAAIHNETKFFQQLQMLKKNSGVRPHPGGPFSKKR